MKGESGPQTETRLLRPKRAHHHEVSVNSLPSGSRSSRERYHSGGGNGGGSGRLENRKTSSDREVDAFGQKERTFGEGVGAAPD